ITADKKIWSYDSIPIHLGNDTGICIKTSLPLDAGPGFISYDWSTGETTQQIMVQTAGEYRVTAAYNPSCISRDTLKLEIYDPKVNIGRDTSLCRNDTYTFQPNAVFNSYLWQDGSTGDSFTADQAGEYWLQVEDNHHCYVRDTAEILTIHELP